jgi:hypothetical protein
MTFVANQTNHYVGPFVRIGLLRRLYEPSVAEAERCAADRAVTTETS